MTKEERINKEYKRLKKIYKDLPQDTLNLYDGLIRRAAFMRISLEDYEADLNTNGHTEFFTQSEKTEPYERERPVARLYNSMNKNYQTIMKQLADKVPVGANDNAEDDILKFALGAQK